jgi:hypothetical protein
MPHRVCAACTSSAFRIKADSASRPVSNCRTVPISASRRRSSASRAPSPSRSAPMSESRARGFEYADAGLDYCRRRGLSVQKCNVERDDPPDESFETAVSFGVAEHLAPWSADRYVKLLCKLSRNVVMSAATPGQDGLDHINEQPHFYWIKRFDFDALVSERFAAEWKQPGVAAWYSFSRRLNSFRQLPHS